MGNRASSRRVFLARSTKAAAAGAAAVGFFSIVPRHVLGGPNNVAPSEKPTRGVVGTGGMGMGHVGMDYGPLLAVCDVDEKHLKNAVERGGPDVKGYRDWREVIAREDIDVIHVPTPPHWHALISIAAAEAGKDVFCEKPMSRTIAEGQKVIEAVNRNGRMFRLNTWFRYNGGNMYGLGMSANALKKLVDSGMLGTPLTLTIGAPTGFNWKFEWSGKINPKPQPVPKELDYDMWLGPAPVKPYHPHRVHGSFRGYWDYDGGGLGDMGLHYVDPAQYLLGKDETSPVFVEADTDQQHPDAVSGWRRIELVYADGTKMVLDGDGRDQDVPYLQGPKGKVWKDYRSDVPDLRKKIESLPSPEPQISEFTDCIRTRKKHALNETNGHRSCTVINLAKIALRTGRPLRFDPDAQRFIDDEGANALVDQPMRSPWHL